MSELTSSLEREAQHYGGGHTVISPVAQRAERLLKVPAAQEITVALATIIAELHNVAGWAAFDSNDDDTARYHFARAMSLGNENGGFQFAKAAYLAGVATAERGHLNDGLKLLQLAQMRVSLRDVGPRTRELKAWIGADAACVLAHMGHSDTARSTLAAARNGWHAPDADDEADMNWLTALVEMHLGRSDSAHRLVAASVKHWEGTQDRRQAILGRMTLAQMHVEAGDGTANERVYHVLKEVRELRSVRARKRLMPLAKALETRSDSESRQLAGLARQVAAV